MKRTSKIIIALVVLAALIVGVLVAWFSGNLFFVAAAGCVVVFLVEMLL